MADTAKYKSLSVAITTWKELGIQQKEQIELDLKW
jgi:hypothetical protein